MEVYSTVTTTINHRRINLYTSRTDIQVKSHSNKHTPNKTKEVQYAFKDSMTHRLLQFALHIAVRCVLHRFKSQDIHREEL